jgi:HEAT repeat protein
VIADIRPAVRASLRQLVEREWAWAVVGEAADGLEAVRLARQQAADVLLVDTAAGFDQGSMARIGESASGPLVVTLLDSPHQHAAPAFGVAVMKGVPAPRLRDRILGELERRGRLTEPSGNGGPSAERIPEEVEEAGLLSALLGPKVQGAAGAGSASRLNVEGDGTEEEGEARPMGLREVEGDDRSGREDEAGESRRIVVIPERTATDVLPPPASPPPEDPSRQGLESEDTEHRRQALEALLDAEIDASAAALAASALQDPEPPVRAQALRVLERVPHLAPIQAVAEAGMDWDPVIRARALTLLGRTGDPSAIPIFEERIADESDRSVVGAGLEGLARLLQAFDAERTDPAALDRVMTVLGRLSPALQSRFSREVALIGRALPESDILARLSSPDHSVRLGAAMAALAWASPAVDLALAERVSDTEPTVRRLAMVALSRLPRRAEDAGEPPAGRIPATDLGPPVPGPSRGDRIPEVRVEAEPPAATGPEPGTGVERTLKAALRASGPEAGDQAIRALAEPRLLPDLMDAASSLPDGDRERLAQLLRDMPEVARLAHAWRGDPDPSRRAAAIRLAGLIGPLERSVVLEGLGDHNADVRVAAAQVAAEVLDPEVTTALLGLITGDGFPRVRHAAVEAFRHAPAEARVAVANRAAAAPDPDVRGMATELLWGGTVEESATLVHLLHHRDDRVVERAIQALGRRSTPETLALLWNSLRSASPDVRRRVVGTLQGFDRGSLALLADQALGSTDPRERAVGLAMVAELDDREALGRLIEALDDPAPEVRIESLGALSRRPSPAALDPAGSRLRDPETTVRALAVGVLRQIEDDHALPYLLDASRDPEEQVNRTAREAILSRRSAAVVDLLVRSLGRPTHRRVASELLVAMGPEVLGILVAALDEADPQTRRAIGEILAAVGAEEWLAERLQDRRSDQRRRAVEALGSMGAEGSIPALIGRLDDPDPTIRARVADILGELGDHRALEPLKRAFVSDPDMDVVSAIEPALRSLASGGATGVRRRES